MNRGSKLIDRLDSWMFGNALFGDWPKWTLRPVYHIAKFLAWFTPRHPFNPWRCDSCQFEAECGYESEDEREIADRWRQEKEANFKSGM